MSYQKYTGTPGPSKKRWKTGNKDLNVSHRKRNVLLENLHLNELLLLDDIDDRVYENTFFFRNMP